MNYFMRMLNRNKLTIALLSGFIGLLIGVATLAARGCEFFHAAKPAPAPAAQARP